MSQKIKILLICSEPFLGVWAYLSIATLAALKKRNIQLYFLYLQVAESLPYESLLDASVQKIPFRLPSNKYLRFLVRFFPLHLLMKVRKLYKKNNFLCAHSLTTGYILSNILWLWPSKLPLIYTVHDLIPHEGARDSLISRYMTDADQRNIRLLPILSTCSQEQQKKAKKIYPDKKVFYYSMPSQVSEIIKNGNAVCPELGTNKGYILFFGGINLYKGLNILVNSYTYSKFIEKTKLVIAGAGSYNPLQGINNANIMFINRFIADTEVRSLFENARCVVYPYTSITQTGAVQYAYFFKVPVIASDLDYFKDCIVDGKTGFLFENRNVDQLSKLLEYVCSDRFDPKPMKLAMAEQYEKCYSEEGLGKALVDMYEIVGKEKKE